MKKRISVGLSMLLVLLLSGCQSSTLAVPELIAGRESSEKTSVVEYRDIYDVGVENAWVNGARECATAQTDGVVTELNKIVGDKVKKGDVILTTVSEELNTQYESMREEMSEAKQNHDMQIRIYQLERKKRTTELSHLQSEAGKDASGEADAKEQSRLMKLCRAEITEIDHNISYENRMYQTKNKVQQEQLSNLEKQRKQNVLKSPCNGIIAQFLNSVTIGSSIAAKQAVVMVYNTDCKVINCGNDEFGREEDKARKGAEDIIFHRLDKEYKVKEYVYTEDQKRAGVSMETSQPTCFIFDGIEDLEIGDMGKLVYKTNVKDHVLSLPNAAIKSEGTKRFVYVTRGNQKEKTYVEIGIKSSQYTEIVSGLSEGDEVSYTAYEGMTANEILDLNRFEETETAFIPKVSEAKVERGEINYSSTIDLEEEYDYGDRYVFEPYHKYQVVDEYDSGVFEKLLVSDGDKVKKGQVIAYVRHDVKKSELVSLQNEIAGSQRQLTQERIQYDKQVKEYKKQLITADTAYERSQINYDLELLKIQYQLTIQSLNQGIKGCQKELAQLQEKSAGVVKAPASGTVTASSVFNKGQSISQADCFCEIIGTDCYMLRVLSWGDLHVNQKVTVTMEDGSKIPGTVVFDAGDVYRGGSESLMSHDEVTQDNYKAFIKADKKPDYKLNVMKVEISCPQLENVLFLPTGALQGMYTGFDESDYWGYCVNKKVGEQDYIKTIITGAGCWGDRDWVIEGLSEGDTVGYLDYSDVDWGV